MTPTLASWSSSACYRQCQRQRRIVNRALQRKNVARNIGVSTRTLLRRRDEYGMAEGLTKFDEMTQ